MSDYRRKSPLNPVIEVIIKAPRARVWRAISDKTEFEISQRWDAAIGRLKAMVEGDV